MDKPLEIIDNNPYILLFDGDCSLCNHTVRFILRFERKPKLVFASLASSVGESIINIHFKNSQLPDSLVLIKNGQPFVKSAAALQIATLLGGLFHVFSIFKVFPVSWLDLFYDWIARNRIKWFGHSTHCGLMPNIDKKRFLDL